MNVGMGNIGKFKAYFDLAREHATKPEYIGLSQQLCEMLIVFLLRRIGPGFYLMAEMNKKEFDWKYKLGFLNGRAYISTVRKINDPKYLALTFNKLAEKALLHQYSIPTPQFLGYLHASRGMDLSGENLKGAEDLRRFLQRLASSKICLKEVAGYGGRGFRAFEVIVEQDVVSVKDLKKQEVLTLDQLVVVLGLDDLKGFLIERYVDQHPLMHELNASSVNTLRLSVYQKPGERAVCYGAFLRMGRKGQLVDNTMAGGIAAKVDLESGFLYPGLEFSSRRVMHLVHPDSKVVLKNFQVPHFDDAKVLACRAIQVLPEIYYAGIDVAITPQGPVIIEFNAMADYSDFAISNQPSRYVLRSSNRVKTKNNGGQNADK